MKLVLDHHWGIKTFGWRERKFARSGWYPAEGGGPNRSSCRELGQAHLWTGRQATQRMSVGAPLVGALLLAVARSPKTRAGTRPAPTTTANAIGDGRLLDRPFLRNSQEPAGAGSTNHSPGLSGERAAGSRYSVLLVKERGAEGR